MTVQLENVINKPSYANVQAKNVLSILNVIFKKVLMGFAVNLLNVEIMMTVMKVSYVTRISIFATVILRNVLL